MTASKELTFGTLHNVIAGLSPLKSLGLAFVAGVLTIFTFAPFHIWPIYIAAISLLVWLIDGARLQTKWRKAVFLRGWAFGAGFTLSSMHWLVSPFLVQPEQHIWFIWMPLILMPAGLGLFFGLGSLLAGLFWSQTAGRIFVFAAMLSVTELLRGIVFGGFPWNWPGMIWAPGQPISQIASLMGLTGLSVITLFISAAPAALADYRPQGGVVGRVLPLFLTVVITGTGWAWGTQRLLTDFDSETLPVRIIDVEIDQSQKYPTDPQGRINETIALREAAAKNILAAYLEGMGDDFPGEPRLVVWPESALPVPLLQDPDTLDAVTLQLGGRQLIAGTTRVDQYSGSQPVWYNSLAVLDERSRLRGARSIYDKHRLVPFGELAAADFIPFGHAISAILPGALQQQATAGFRPGPRATTLELTDEIKFLPLICYEALFPGLVRSGVADADLLVNISIDSWFGSGIGPEQHYAQAKYRSIETGRPLVRGANLGKSGANNLYGEEIQSNINQVKHGEFTVKVIDSFLPLQIHNTTYSRLGELLTSVALLLLLLITYFYRQKA